MHWTTHGHDQSVSLVASSDTITLNLPSITAYFFVWVRERGDSGIKMIHSSTVEKWEKRRAKIRISNVNWSVAEPPGTCSDRLDDRPTFS